MSRSRSITAGLAWLCVVPLLVGTSPAGAVAPSPAVGPAASVAEGRDPTSFPRGSDARVTWLGGATLHTRKGRAFGLPIPASEADVTRLLGRSRHSWVVAILGGPLVASTSVRRIHHGRYRTVVTVPSYYDRPTYLLSRHGEQLVTVDYDRGGADVTAYDLDGRVLGRFASTLGAEVLDMVGDEVFLSGRKTVRWRPGSPPAPYATASALVDVARDVVFLATHPGVGPTPLSAPGTPAPSMRGFAPRAVSPDGRWVAGYRAASITGRSRELEVRSMADGSLQPTTGLLLQPNAAIGWEDADHLLVGVRGRLGNALARCALDGTCERASDWLPGQAISLPHQPEYFLDWP